MTGIRSKQVPDPYLPHLAALPKDRFAGIVRDYYSNPSGPGVRPGWSQMFTGPAGAMGFGRSLAGTHVGRDLYCDVLVGAPGSGTVYLYRGQAGSLQGTPIPAATLSGGTSFGTSL